MLQGIPGLMVARGIFIFNPASITGLKIWLKADALSLNDGDAVGTWTDSSGNGFDATQATAGSKPIYKTNIVNGKPIVRCDGSDDSLGFSGSALDIFKNVGSGTIVCVCSDTNNSAGNDGHSPVGFTVTAQATTRLCLETRDATVSNFFSRARRLDNDSGVNSTIAFSAGFHVLVADADWTNNTNQIFVDGTAGSSIGFSSGGGSTSNTTSAEANVGMLGATGGATNHFPGDIAEVFVYQPKLSATDRQSIESYLKTKYATP